jgi:hypothetical protein
LLDFVSDVKHIEKVYPWHNPKPKGKSAVMDPQSPDEDTDVMPKNLGTKLGKNLGEAPRGEVTIEYKQGTTLRFKQRRKIKEVQTYSKEDDPIYVYDLQYAPHHLIPGNESLKNSGVIPFLGDKNAIQHFGSESHIKEGMTVGYDVNHASNGVWLPSPYALSMSNKWPSESGLDVIKKRKGQRIANETEALRMAYVAAAIESTKMQFHMRRVDYSREVKKSLNAIGRRLKIMAGGSCSIAKDSQDKGKIDPPMGLVGRLTTLSGNLRSLLVGSVWLTPIFTDKLSKQYAEEKLKHTESKGSVKQVM